MTLVIWATNGWCTWCYSSEKKHFKIFLLQNYQYFYYVNKRLGRVCTWECLQHSVFIKLIQNKTKYTQYYVSAYISLHQVLRVCSSCNYWCYLATYGLVMSLSHICGPDPFPGFRTLPSRFRGCQLWASEPTGEPSGPRKWVQTSDVT